MRLITTTVSLLNLISKSFNYVVETSKLYNIDESHALKHSIEVYRFAKEIYQSELITNPYLEKQKEIIYVTSIGHDMCDKKYMNEKEGIVRYQTYLSEYISMPELEIIGKIIGTMSYSKVKNNGYPELGQYQLAYHIVREADLLAAYDIDRCIIYGMYKDKLNYKEALEYAINLFDNRIFTMRSDGLFITNYSKNMSLRLHENAKRNIENLKNIL